MEFWEYRGMISEALRAIDPDKIDEFKDFILECIQDPKHLLLVMGNGGSAAIGDHLSCDMGKGIHFDTSFLSCRVLNLSSMHSTFTAYSNDMGYDSAFEYMVNQFSGTHALAISSSGNSPNVISGLNQASRMGMKTAALVGFDGGRILKENLADVIVHVKAKNYGVVEDCHQCIMHYTAQAIRTLCKRSSLENQKL